MRPLLFKDLTEKGIDILCNAVVRQIKEAGVYTTNFRDIYPSKESLKKHFLTIYNCDVINSAVGIYWDLFQILTNSNMKSSIMLIKLLTDKNFYDACVLNNIYLESIDTKEFNRDLKNVINHELGYISGLQEANYKFEVTPENAKFLYDACAKYKPIKSTVKFIKEKLEKYVDDYQEPK